MWVYVILIKDAQHDRKKCYKNVKPLDSPFSKSWRLKIVNSISVTTETLGPVLLTTQPVDLDMLKF